VTGAGEYEWCTLHYQKQVKEFWEPGMPNKSGECVQVKQQASGALALQNVDCSTNMHFICEVREIPKVRKLTK